MKKWKYTVIALSFIGLSGIQAQSRTRDLSLAQACRLAVDSNLEVLNAQLETKKSLQELRKTQSKLYPHLEGYSNFNYYYAIPQMLFPGEFFGSTGEIPVEIGTKYDWSSGFRSSLTLVNMSCYTAVRLAKQMQNLSQLDTEQKKEEIAYQVWQVYYLCQSTGSQIDYLEKNMANTNQLLEITRNQVDNGTARKIDYSKVLVTKNNLQTEIDNLTKLHEQQLNLLRFLTGVDYAIPLKLTTSLFSDKIPVNMGQPDFDITTNIRQLDKQIEIASLNKRMTRQEYIPTLSTTDEFYYQGQENTFNFFEGGNKFFKVGYIGLNLSIPITGGFEKHAKIQQYKIEQLQLENSKKLATQELQKNYLDAVKQYENSLNTVSRQQENIQLAEEDYKVSLEQYNQQVMPLSDLMLSDNSLTEARLSYIDALLQLRNAELEIKKIKGELLKF